MHTLRHLARLTRVRIALLATLSAAAGFLLARPRPTLALPLTCLAVLALAMGASALNQCLERDVDARMPRTRTRPLPAGALTLPAALLVAAVLIVLGAALLFAQQAVAAGLGLAAVVLYNGAYTPLKRLTAFAAVPGGVIGTLPPAVGWTVAGGTLQDPRLVTLGFLFFVWQVPHFWLLLLTHGEEYARAGLPTLTHTLGRAALARVTFAWLATAALSAPLLAWCGLTRSPWTAIALVISAGLLLRSASALLRPGAAARAAFGAINVFACAVMVLLVLDATLASGASAPR